MFTTKILLILTILLMTSAVMADSADDTPDTLFVVFENVAISNEADQKAAINTAKHLLHSMAMLGKRRKTRNTEIIIIRVKAPNKIAWSGTAKQLQMNIHKVATLLKSDKGFNDIKRVYEMINTTIALRGISKFKIYHVGSFINVPFDKQQKDIVINLPQDIPKDLALTSMISKVTTLALLNVHADQKVAIQLYLEQSGILERAQKGELDLRVYEASETKSHLKNLL